MEAEHTISNKTRLIKKTITTTKASELGFKEVKDETVFHEYKKFEGLMAPVKMTVFRDGKKYVESNVSSVTYPAQVDESEFKKPE